MWESGGGHRRWGWYAGGGKRKKPIAYLRFINSPPATPSTSPERSGEEEGGRVVSPPRARKKGLLSLVVEGFVCIKNKGLHFGQLKLGGGGA